MAAEPEIPSVTGTPADSAPAGEPVQTPPTETAYTPDGVPTLEGVREKIETRYGAALGATELAEATPEARTAAEQFEARHKAAAEKLDEIRASMDRAEPPDPGA